jgi:hypothetical protein
MGMDRRDNSLDDCLRHLKQIDFNTHSLYEVAFEIRPPPER